MSRSNEPNKETAHQSPFQARLNWFLTKSFNYICIGSLGTCVLLTFVDGLIKGQPSSWDQYMLRLNEAFFYLTLYLIGGVIWTVYGWPWKRPKG